MTHETLSGSKPSVFSVLPFFGVTLLTGLFVVSQYSNSVPINILEAEEKAAEKAAAEKAAAEKAAADAETARLAKEAEEKAAAEKEEVTSEDFEAIAEKAYASIIKSLPGSPNGFNKMDRSKQIKILQNLAKDLKCAQGHDTFQDLKDAFESTSHENEFSSKWTLFPKFESEYGKVVCLHDEL